MTHRHVQYILTEFVSAEAGEEKKEKRVTGRVSVFESQTETESMKESRTKN